MCEKAIDKIKIRCKKKILCSLLLNLGRTVHKFMVPEFVCRILDEFNERDEQAPWVWSVHNKPLQQNPVQISQQDRWLLPT